MHQTSTRSYSNVCWVVIGIGATLGLFLLAAVAWLAYSSAVFLMSLKGAIGVAMQQAMEPMIVVLDFQGNLAVGNVELAYDLTTEEFHRRQTLEDFVKLLDKHPELHGEWINTAVDNPAADSCTYKITTQTDDGRRFTFELRLRKEEEKWKINEIVLEDHKDDDR